MSSAESVTLAFDHPDVESAVRTWAKEQGLHVHPLEGPGPPWEDMAFRHGGVEIESEDPDKDIVFWLEDLEDLVRERWAQMDREPPEEGRSLFLWQEYDATGSPSWYRLWESTRTPVDILAEDVLEPKNAARKPEGYAAALAAINRHRVQIGMPKLDPAAAGWTPEDVFDEAERIRRLAPLLSP